MKKFILRGSMVLPVIICFLQYSYAQRDNIPNRDITNEISKLNYLYDLSAKKTFDINRLPINICFIEHQEKYVGFVIAGHATKEVCQVASLQVKNFMDSVKHSENSVFSFGVGFDLCSSSDSFMYDSKLKNLEKIFIDLQKEYLFEVRVSHVADTVFKSLSNKIKDNAKLAFESMEHMDSVNRVIFRYNNIQFPVPVPFYTKDSIIKFLIPKTDIGNIPGASVFNQSIIDNALKEIKSAIDVNTLALNKLRLYVPDDYSRFVGIPYYISYYAGGKANKDTMMLSGVYNENNLAMERGTRYWSLAELQRKCDNREGKNITVIGQNKKIDACTAINIIKTQIKNLDFKKSILLDILTRTNRALDNEKNKIIQFKSQFKNDSASDRNIFIDAFLRGWCFKGGTEKMNTQLSNWYKKREVVWKNILAENEDYKKRIIYEKGNMSAEKIIAGIFHSEDVFFVAKDTGKEYLVTPYKMLSGDFIQVIDKKNNTSQFISENNFRLTKL